MMVMAMNASVIFEWLTMFVDHTKDCTTDENIQKKALAYEYKLAEDYKKADYIDYILDDNFIQRYRTNRRECMSILDKLINYIPLLDNGFPLLGSMINSYCKLMEEVTDYGGIR